MKLRRIILDAYSAKKEIKEYFDFFINPDSDKLAEEYRKKISREFMARNGKLKPYPRRTVCKRLIKEMSSFNPSPDLLAEVILFYVSIADKWMREMTKCRSEQMSESIAQTLCEAMNLILKEGLMHRFGHEIEMLIDNAAYWGYWGKSVMLRNEWEEAKSRLKASLLS